MTDFTNAETVRAILEPTAKAAASEAVREFVTTHPHWQAPAPKPEQPAYVKWGAGIGATLVATFILWMAFTLNTLQITVARIDERQISDTSKADILDLQKRVTALERERPHK